MRDDATLFMVEWRGVPLTTSRSSTERRDALSCWPGRPCATGVPGRSQDAKKAAMKASCSGVSTALAQ